MRLGVGLVGELRKFPYWFTDSTEGHRSTGWARPEKSAVFISICVPSISGDRPGWSKLQHSVPQRRARIRCGSHLAGLQHQPARDQTVGRTCLAESKLLIARKDPGMGAGLVGNTGDSPAGLKLPLVYVRVRVVG